MLPKISIITPTLNQSEFIEETIKSVIYQNYPNLEYIVIDGGSTDGTVKILKKYSQFLSFISEPDNGQSDAINKGLKLSTGEIIAYINSDDIYLPDCLNKVGEFFLNNPEPKIVTGKCINIDGEGNETRSFITRYKNVLLKLNIRNFLKITNFISQPAAFWRKELIYSIGFFDTKLRYAMDYDYWLRIAEHHKVYFYNDYLAKFRIYPKSISGSNSKMQFSEEYKVASKYSKGFIKLISSLHSRISFYIYKTMFKTT